MSNTSGRKILCFLDSGAESIEGSGKFSLEDVDPTLCNTVVYFEAAMRIALTDDLKFKYSDEDVGKVVSSRAAALRAKSSHFELLLDSLLVVNADLVDKIKKNNLTFEQFGQNLADGLVAYNYNGMIVNYQSTNLDAETLKTFAEQTTAAFKKQNLTYIAYIDLFDLSTKLTYNYFDYIMLNTFGYGFPEETLLRHISPLHSRADETGFELFRNVDWIVNYFANNGMPKNKMLMGVTFNANTYKIDAGKHQLGAAVKSAGIQGEFTKAPGHLTHYEVKDALKQGSWTTTFDETQKVSYSYTDSDWMTFESKESMKHKGEYIVKHDLGGAYVLCIDSDDFVNEEKFPLINQLLTSLKK